MSYKEIFKWVAKTMLSSIIWLSIFAAMVAAVSVWQNAGTTADKRLIITDIKIILFI